MKSTVTCLLVLALVVPAWARQRTPQEQARRMPRGSRIQVELKARQIVQGAWEK
jgi:hypothetical protein